MTAHARPTETAPLPGDEQRRCWTLLGPEPTAQCLLYNGHAGDHDFGTRAPDATLAAALAEDAQLLHSFVHLDVPWGSCDGARCVRRREQVRAALAAVSPQGEGPGLREAALREATEIIEDIAIVAREDDDSCPLLDELPVELGDRIAAFLNGRAAAPLPRATEGDDR